MLTLRMQIIPTMGGAIRTGYNRSELNATMDGLQIKRKHRAELFADVVYCESVALEVLNRD